ncbi:GNAT family N-acetyltransferase [Cyclobacterium marinum]|uniref:GCN5-related N-acetyltransferase n=1 Tax=Cyclobacterium marinum (strain ATCC 25205 / DSM 745 / LMG 13164 / NCIMB 1802) TaxID=880070 RepID=G0J129_CYCMS|nr:GNAT family N-acetyltransferase [Cyclobacterium marinum]AEL25778.1 GCN5-related N-acetyltransferase [Cyclobacterium marinum DSM 745]MBI0401210.1 GNAT family N-acetyltransferase [Cyclobacterium marinum]MBR9775338.1 GNAT family N-acetyltransferase [Cytophagales bacterium]|tara:strand:- start:18282 stop:18698 length:417 start_codon:yes stop_codon:yes gene_type:complete
MLSSIAYQAEPQLKASDFQKLLISSTLGERRPVGDLKRLEKMLLHADLILTARKDGELIGIARSISDESYCTYLSDLAVHIDFQKQGIGKKLVKLTKEAFPLANLILLSAPKAVDYYPKIGMKKHPHCFLSVPKDPIY